MGVFLKGEREIQLKGLWEWNRGKCFVKEIQLKGVWECLLGGNGHTPKRYMGVLYGKIELSKIEIEIENVNRIWDFCLLKSVKCEPDMYGAERCMGVFIGGEMDIHLKGVWECF